MAKELFQPILSGVNTPTYIAPGVVDKSKAMSTEAMTGLISSVGNQAIEAWKGYEVARQERNVEGLISEYMQQPTEEQRQTNIANLTRDVQEQSIAIDKQWEMGSEGATLSGIEAGEKVLAEKQSKLTAALKQGRITPDEFNTRLLATLRESINRTPGFERELVAQTERVMKYSGMGGYLEAEAKELARQQKQERDLEEWYIKEGVKLGINPQAPHLRETVMLTHRRIQSLDFAEKEARASKTKRELYFSDPNIFGELSTSYHTSYISKVSGIAYDPNLTPEQKILSIEAATAGEDRRFATMFGDNANAPQVQSVMAGMKPLKDAYIKFASGEMTAAALKTQVEASQHAARHRLGNYDQVAALEQLSKLPPMFYDQYLTENKWASDIVEGLVRSIGKQGFGNINPGRDRGAVKDFVSSVVKQAKESPEKAKDLEGVYESFIKTIDEKMQDRTTRAEGVMWADNFIAGLVTSGPTASLTNPELRGKMISQVRSYLDSAGKSLVEGGRYSDGTEVRIPENTEVQVLKDGTVLFWNPQYPQEANKLNREFGTRMNNAVKAIAHISGNQDYYGTLQSTQARDVLVNMLNASGKQVRAPEAPKPITQQVDYAEKFAALERSGDTAISPEGAIGRYQIMPETAKRLGYSPEDMKNPAVAKEAANKLGAMLGQKYQGDWLKIAAAYNAGEGSVDRAIKTAQAKASKGIKRNWWEYLPDPETRDYVERARKGS